MFLNFTKIEMKIVLLPPLFAPAEMDSLLANFLDKHALRWLDDGLFFVESKSSKSP